MMSQVDLPTHATTMTKNIIMGLNVINLVNYQELVFSVFGVALAFVLISTVLPV